MYDERKKVVWFALISRVAILILQFIFNLICPDHHADAFRGPVDDSDKVTFCDNIIAFLFNGLTRWDGQYFIHIAKYGYTYENVLAFYPLYPKLIQLVAIFIRKVFFLLNIHSSIIVAAVLINTVCFVKSAVILYDLSKIVLKKKSVAYKAAILYCINPASIFFSAIYSESLFAYLTYYSMLESIKLNPYVCFPIGLSIFTRSNGMVNIGFPIYFSFKKLCDGLLTKSENFSLKTLSRFIFKVTTLQSLCLLCNTIIISIVPFLLLQIYNYILFCIPHSNQTFIPEHIINYGTINNLILPGSDKIEWCSAKIPIAYTSIQKKYWNVGLFKYYEIKQTPNFILAFPILYIMIKCIKEYFLEYREYCFTLGLIENIKNKKFIEAKKYPPEMFVFIIHGLFLTIFCILFVHIQVSTRLISSASPLIYWYCALIMSYEPCGDNDTAYENDKNVSSRWKVFFLTQKKYSFEDKLVIFYFLGYTILGSFMFPNFLPWT
ncbi:phosphatidylinositol glycan anchor biosynthesis class V [Calliopsis andreniformis]|uniref:phosphatidylinositol glycan anchor biosynthesis class V n=1 Tax=Calliopsis andreniformis TaxID=337506 RepID=UPI003FCD2328